MSNKINRLFFDKGIAFSPSVIILIIANLIPVYGVFVWDWKIFPILFLFWAENVVIGVFNIIRIFFSDPSSIYKWIIKIFMIPFFAFHYGMFTLVHGIFIIEFFSPEKYGTDLTTLPPNLLTAFLGEGRGLIFAFLALFLSHGFSFLYNYIGKREYERANLGLLMFGPYKRITMLHIVIIFGGFMAMGFNSSIGALLILVAFKVYFDIKAHNREHKSQALFN